MLQLIDKTPYEVIAIQGLNPISTAFFFDRSTRPPFQDRVHTEGKLVGLESKLSWIEAK